MKVASALKGLKTLDKTWDQTILFWLYPGLTLDGRISPVFSSCIGNLCFFSLLFSKSILCRILTYHKSFRAKVSFLKFWFCDDTGSYIQI